MSEWIVVILVILALIGLVIYKYRRQLQTGWVMWQTFRRLKQQMKPKQKSVETKSRSTDTQLVRCPKCNKWTPQEDSVKLKSNYFCSHACMEESLSFNK
ncbi:MAG: hypothetical protein HKN25_11815 [Pyrinomonadaceae bacterium]|nr:hypothetical protein [Pyrinomonadaceae bacterium]